MHRIRPHIGIGLGFVTVSILMVGLLLLVIAHMSAIKSQIDVIVQRHNVKTSLIVDMREALFKRQVLLRNLFFYEDVFDREEKRHDFYALAVNFVEARSELSNMPLNVHEQNILGQINKLAEAAYPKQNALVDLSLTGVHAEDVESQMHEVFAVQEMVMKKMTGMLLYQKEATEQAVSEATQSYSEARQLIIGLGGLATFMSWLIAGYVVYRTQVQTREIRDMAKFPIENPAPVLRIAYDGTVLYANNVAITLLKDWNCKIGEILFRQWHQKIINMAKAVTVSEHEIELGDKIFSLVVTPFPDEEYINIYAHDITEQEQMKRQIAYQASHDTLTGLINRREFEIRLKQMLESAHIENKIHSLLYVDLDQFKIVNDTCGHIAGDELLKQLAGVLLANIRGSDTLARLGGDEFGLLLIGCPLEQAQKIAKMVGQVINEFRFYWDGKTFEVGASIGVASITADSGSYPEILSAADSACYIAKDEGRNRVHVYQPDDAAISQRQGEMQWVHHINAALREQRFCLYHQRILPLSPVAPKHEHCEFLLRMMDKKGQIIAPMPLIRAAERYDLMPTLDRWVIDTAFNILKTRPVSTKLKKFSYAINLSGQSLGSKELLSYILDQLQLSEIQAESICFEITETAAIANLADAVHFISVLKAKGCRFALDDFGSGLSSFNYLKNLNVDYLKIDGSFIRNIAKDRIAYVMVEAINRIGHEMGIKTIAEHVENDEILALVTELGIDFAQGYSIHIPSTVDELNLDSTGTNVA